MSYDYKINIISPDATSGSVDNLRSAMGAGYWATQTDPDDGNPYLEFIPLPDLGATGAGDVPSQSEMLAAVMYNTEFRERVSNEKIMPNWKMPVRIVGDSEKIKSDSFWKSYLIGGPAGSDDLPGIFNRTASINHDHSFEYDMPWPYIQSVNFPDHDLDNLIRVTSEYSSHVPVYETYAADTDERLLFNVYAYISTYLAITTGALHADRPSEDQIIDPDIVNFVTREGQIDVRSQLEEEVEEQGIHQALSPYYESMPIMPLSASTETAIKHKLSHIIFDEDAFRGLSVNPVEGGAGIGSAGILEIVNALAAAPDLSDRPKSVFPFSINIEIPFKQPGEAAQAIMNNNLSAKFMKTLKESFSDQIDSLPPLKQAYPLKQEYATFNEDNSGVTQIKNVSADTIIRSLDYVDMLTHIYNNFLASDFTACTFMNFQNWKDKAAFDTTGAYRYSNTIDAYNTIRDLIKNTENRYSLTTAGDAKYFIDSLGELYNSADSNKKFVDTLAYRVEKIGGPPSGDARTQNVLQQYWIFNGSDVDELEEDITSTFKLYDTQVKYNTKYTYNIYAYVLVGGLKYKYSDLRITRKIGETTYAKGPGSTLTLDHNCLEFYDPYTEETATQLLADTDELAEYNELVTNAQITDSARYLADFNLSYEPTYKIMEIPIFTKTLSVMDNPGNSIDVEPFYLKNQSQTIGFKIGYDAWSPSPLPFPITLSNFRYNVEYLIAHDMLPGNSVTLQSASKQKFLEVYRTSKRPTSYTDFNGALWKTVDLARIEDDMEYASSMVCFYDKIAPNTKYYYTFRMVNEQETPSYISPIYLTELIDNGGYMYAEFTTLYQQDLIEETYTNPFKKLKKLLHLQPNLSHLMFDDDLVDYSQSAESQLDNLQVGISDDSIWGKTFKIRLTSKKTGKKMDLNVTYNLNSE